MYACLWLFLAYAVYQFLVISGVCIFTIIYALLISVVCVVVTVCGVCTYASCWDECS